VVAEQLYSEQRKRIKKFSFQLGAESLKSATNGVLDGTFNPDASAGVTAISASGGSLYAAGMFSTIGGLTRPGLAKLDLTTGSADAALNANISFTGEGMGGVAVSGDYLYLWGNLSTNGASKNISSVHKATGAWVPGF
jgi:hypothetical protein